MKANNPRFRSHCPINVTQELVGDRWSLLIIRDILFARKTHYGEFLTSAERISTNILADRLEKLERHGILSKTRETENRSRYRYVLTQKGQDLLPMLLEMIIWGARHDPETAAPAEFVEQLTQHRADFMRQVLAAVE